MKILINCTVLLLLILLISVSSAFGLQHINFGEKTTGIEVLDQNQDGVTFEISIGEIGLQTVSTPLGKFNIALISGFGGSENVGCPDLPHIGKLIAIPYCNDLQTEIIYSETEEISLAELGLSDPIIPAQPQLPKSSDGADIPFEYDREIYSKDDYYSEPLVQAEMHGIMRNVLLGGVIVSPIQYNPVKNKLRIYTNIVLRVYYDSPEWPETKILFEQYYSPFFEPIYEQIPNYRELMSVISTKDTVDLIKEPVSYLIVSDIMFKPQLQPFIEWKTQKGFEVITAYTQDIGYTAVEIEAYIDSLYYTLSPPPSFVLLVGDVEQIPAFDGIYGDHITDLWYCELTGDNIADIYYGRFSAQNPEQLQPQIDKTIEYEKYEMPNPDYLAEATLVAGIDPYGYTYGNGQINYMTDYYFNEAHGIYPYVWLCNASGLPGAADSIIQSVSDGVGVYNYCGHCDHWGPRHPAFKNDDVFSLGNYHEYILGIGNCCQSNTFGYPDSPCFGEALLQLEERGGIGYIGGSNSTYWAPDYHWAVGFGPVIADGPLYIQTTQGAFDGLFHDHGEPVSSHYVTNAAIIFAGNLAVVASGSKFRFYYWEIYHLMGDPSVTTYLGIPAELNIQHPDSLLISDESITVMADPDSYAGITINGQLKGAGYIDSSGQAEITLEPFETPGLADIVVTAQNKIPYFSTIKVGTPGEAFVVVNDYAVNEINGNDDGEVNNGESISLDIELVNAGPDSVFDITARLRTTDSLVAITDSTEECAAIPGNFELFNTFNGVRVDFKRFQKWQDNLDQ